MNITANMSSMVRKDTLEGKEYLVFPVIMMVEGVHCGSGGPIFYSSEELSKFPASWDSKPVVINHPEEDGKPVSGASPDVANSTKVGILYNTTFEDGKLKSEAWLDPDKLKGVSKESFDRLEANDMLEVSIGVFFDEEKAGGTWKQEDYLSVARNLRPDHLAILPFNMGACSIKDGGGMPRVNKAEERSFESSRIVPCANEISQFDLPNKLSEKLGNKHNTWIEDVYADYFVYGVATDSAVEYYKKSYGLVEPDEVVLDEKSEKVRRRIVYENMEVNTMSVPKTNDEEAITAVKQEPVTLESYIDNAPSGIKEILTDALAYVTAEKNELIENITANSDIFTKEDLSTKSFTDVKKMAVFISSVKKEAVTETSTANFVGKAGGVTSNSSGEIPTLPNVWA